MILGFSARARQADPHEAEVAAGLSYAAQVMPRSEVATVLAAFDEDRQVASQPLLTRRTDSQSTVLAVGEVKHWMQADRHPPRRLWNWTPRNSATQI